MVKYLFKDLDVAHSLPSNIPEYFLTKKKNAITNLPKISMSNTPTDTSLIFYVSSTYKALDLCNINYIKIIE